MGVLFVEDDEVLLVEPTHDATWTIPGGPVGIGETPRAAATRLLGERLGLEREPGRLLAVDWAPHVREERVRFVFDGGALTEAQLDAIVLEPDDLTSWAFLPPDELFVMVEPRLCRRITAALDARARGATLYLEHGEPA